MEGIIEEKDIKMDSHFKWDNNDVADRTGNDNLIGQRIADAPIAT